MYIIVFIRSFGPEGIASQREGEMHTGGRGALHIRDRIS
jgi:hypothetical protein